MSVSSQSSHFSRLVRGVRYVLEYDFCPNVNQYVYWLKNPLAQLLLAAVGGAAVGATVAVQGWLICAAALTIAMLGVVWPWLGMKGIRATLSVDQQRCMENEPVLVSLTLTNRWPWQVWGLKLQQGFNPLGSILNELDFALAAVPAWSKGVYQWELIPELRGEYPRETVRVSTSFPFGLYEVSLPVEIESRLMVHPRTTTIVPLEIPSGKRWSVTTSDTNSFGREGEVLGTRPYRQGDSMRDVHWSLTARYDRWIVCERQTSKSHAVRVLLDVDPAIHCGTGANASLEWGLRFSATICESLVRYQSQATLLLDHERLIPALHGVERTKWCEALARWQPAGNQPVSETLLRSLQPYDFFITTDRRMQQFTGSLGCRVVTLRTLPQRNDYESWLQIDLTNDHESGEVWEQFRTGWEERSRHVQLLGA